MNNQSKEQSAAAVHAAGDGVQQHLLLDGATFFFSGK